MTYPVDFFVSNLFSSKNLNPSLIDFKGIFSFLDKSFNLISLLYFERNNVYK